MLVGTRFAFDVDGEGPTIRNGMGRSIVIEAAPISGPVYLHWHHGYFARCVCGERSRSYKIKVRALQAWAHGHRCDVVYRSAA
jgi:hypothetical protein